MPLSFFLRRFIAIMLARIVILTVLVAACFAALPTFTFCGSGTLTNPKVTTPETTWKAGTTVHFTMAGTLTAPIVANSTVQTIAKFLGSEVANKVEDLCTYDGTPFVCPEATGERSWYFTWAIPTVPMSGKLTSRSDFKNADGSAILCMDLALQL